MAHKSSPRSTPTWPPCQPRISTQPIPSIIRSGEHMTKILAINTIGQMTAEQQGAIMLEEVQVVAQMYVDGRIEQYWRREDGKGAVLLLSTSSLDEAEILVRELPLT